MCECVNTDYRVPMPEMPVYALFCVGLVLYAAAFIQFGVCLPGCIHIHTHTRTLTHAYAPIITETYRAQASERTNDRTNRKERKKHE